jgi:hypothetical protein
MGFVITVRMPDKGKEIPMVAEWVISIVMGKAREIVAEEEMVTSTGTVAGIKMHLPRNPRNPTTKISKLTFKELNISRKKVMADILSKGFSHFYKQLNTGRHLTFKCLRKTYITRLEIFMGHGNTKAITGHSDDSVIERNYLDKRELAKAAKRFQVFINEEERGNNFKEIRETSKTQSKQLNK